MTHRVHQQRTVGWRLPPGGRSIARPSRWGNPWRVTQYHDLTIFAVRWTVQGPGLRPGEILFTSQVDAHRFAVGRYVRALTRNQLRITVAEVRAHLAGAPLACYCPLHLPCHVDPMLLIANSAGPVTAEHVLALALASYRRG